MTLSHRSTAVRSPKSAVSMSSSIRGNEENRLPSEDVELPHNTPEENPFHLEVKNNLTDHHDELDNSVGENRKRERRNSTSSNHSSSSNENNNKSKEDDKSLFSRFKDNFVDKISPSSHKRKGSSSSTSSVSDN